MTSGDAKEAPAALGPAALVAMQCPVARFQHHSGDAVLRRLRPGEPLVIRREPGNPHDPRAVTVEWRDVMLGYVPREANYMLSQMMDRGLGAQARVVRVQQYDTRQQVMIEVSCAQPVASPPREDPLLPSGRILVRSLMNRIFGPHPPERAWDWVAARVGPIALAGVEYPAILPFLRLVFMDWNAAQRADPLVALHELLLAHWLDARAWKRLPRWGFDAFSRLDQRIGPTTVALFANLLLRMDVQRPPPPNFSREAMEIAYYRQPEGQVLDFDRHPVWFMRAIMEGVSLARTRTQLEALRDRVHCCVDWLLDARPAPDANQQRAGWFWVMPRALAFREGRMAPDPGPWTLPVGEMTFGPWWVVPMRNRAELAAEAVAMKNCLGDYEDDCRCGSAVVFSIRDALTAERAACFVVGRAQSDENWEIEQIAGMMNAAVGDGLREVAERVLERMRGAG